MRGLIPVNTTYERFNGKYVFVGDGLTRFPEPFLGDRFFTKDYYYEFFDGKNVDGNKGDNSISGWKVNVKNRKKVAYSPILSEVNGFPVIALFHTFKNCANMKVSPKIPESVLDITAAYEGCQSLIETPEIPDGVKYMTAAFRWCKSLTKPPIIPESATRMADALMGCFSMTGTIICNAALILSCDGILHGTKIDKVEGTCEQMMKDYFMQSKVWKE